MNVFTCAYAHKACMCLFMYTHSHSHTHTHRLQPRRSPSTPFGPPAACEPPCPRQTAMQSRLRCSAPSHSASLRAPTHVPQITVTSHPTAQGVGAGARKTQVLACSTTPAARFARVPRLSIPLPWRPRIRCPSSQTPCLRDRATAAMLALQATPLLRPFGSGCCHQMFTATSP